MGTAVQVPHPQKEKGRKGKNEGRNQETYGHAVGLHKHQTSASLGGTIAAPSIKKKSNSLKSDQIYIK